MSRTTPTQCKNNNKINPAFILQMGLKYLNIFLRLIHLCKAEIILICLKLKIIQSIIMYIVNS